MAKKKPKPDGEPMHQWEDVGQHLVRCRVPGGWLYSGPHDDSPITFVPTPPDESLLAMLQDGSFAEAMGSAFHEILIRTAGEAGSCRKCGETQPDLDGAKNCWKCGEPLPERPS